MNTTSRFRRQLLPDATHYYHQEGLKLIGRGDWRTALCPFHRDRTPSLSVRVPGGGFCCHACGAKGGDILDFHRRRHGLDFVTAAKELGAWDTTTDTSARNRIAPKKPPVDPVKLAARKFAKRHLGDDFAAEALHVYRDRSGFPIYYLIRARNRKTGGKWIRPMHRNGHHFVLGKPEFTEGTPLYNLHLIASRTSERVIVCEGEKCADALCKVGLLATTSGSATSAGRANWQSLTGRDVLIWPDLDESGQRYAEAVADGLRSIACQIRIIDSSRLGLDRGGDAVDWLASNPDASGDAILSLPIRHMHKPLDRRVDSDPPLRGRHLHAVEEKVAEWITLRCTRGPRVAGGLHTLHRDYSDWVEPGFGLSLDRFESILVRLDIAMDNELVAGLALIEDVMDRKTPHQTSFECSTQATQQRAS